METDKPVQFGIIGVGRIARHAFAPSLQTAAGAELAAAASRDIERARALNPKRVYDNYQALLEDTDVEAVYIGTHNGLHHPLAVNALERGKHVLCEKPLACNAAQCEEMMAAANQHGRVLAEAFMYRHHPCMAEARSLLENGAIGDIRTVEASFSFLLDDFGDVRFNDQWGGGGVLDVGCYCVNACRYLLGKAPVAVTAMGAFHPKYGVDTTLHGVLDFGSGRHGVVSCGFDGGMRNRITVCGSKGVLTFPRGFDTNGKPVRLLIVSGGESRDIDFEPSNVFQLEIEDFARAVRGAKPLLTTEDSLQNAQVMDALLESARQGGARISVPG